MTGLGQPIGPRLYHRTAAGSEIVRAGFRDSAGSYGLATMTLCGVFVSDVPLDENEGACGPDLLEVQLPPDVDLRDYEIVEALKPYREWCVPAALLNEQATLRLLTDEEVDAAVYGDLP
jgi:hypothetical protein